MNYTKSLIKNYSLIGINALMIFAATYWLLDVYIDSLFYDGKTLNDIVANTFSLLKIGFAFIIITVVFVFKKL